MNRFLLLKKIVLSFSIVSVSLAFGSSPDIVGGVEVLEADGEAASTVGLVTRTPQGTGLCTASILASDILVTAAHCVSESHGQATHPSNVRVLFGKNLNGKNVKVQLVTGVKVHPKWKGDFSRGVDQGDIAILRFSGGLPAEYRTAKLLPSKTSLQRGGTALLIGYGVSHMDENGGTGAGILRKVDAVIDSPRFGKTEVLLDQRNGRGACHGDSGGPAFIRDRAGNLLLWGVTNRADPETAGDCSEGSVYTRITAHSSFIQSTIKELRAPNK